MAKHAPLTIVLALAPLLAVAQDRSQPSEDSIWLGTTLTIGMPQDVVMSKLGGHYTLKRADVSAGTETWFVIPKDFPLWHVVASVDFRERKLTSVQKEWGPDDQQKGAEFAQGVYGAIAQFAKEGRRDCWITAKQKEEPNTEVKGAYIICGEKYIQVLVMRLGAAGTGYGKTEAATVSEVLGTGPPDVYFEKLLYDLKKKQQNTQDDQQAP